jgi:hypothetical protein
VKAALSLTFLLAALVLPGGCAFVPKEYPRLEEARAAKAQVKGDARATQLAAAELARADEALERARIARDTLDDPATVDHLAYVAKQRYAIARAAAELRDSLAAIEQETSPPSPP